MKKYKHEVGPNLEGRKSASVSYWEDTDTVVIVGKKIVWLLDVILVGCFAFHAVTSMFQLLISFLPQSLFYIQEQATPTDIFA